MPMKKGYGGKKMTKSAMSKMKKPAMGKMKKARKTGMMSSMMKKKRKM